ncbi:BTAD domain-containing putative transcriptional regulator [Streptomyces sp. NPDC059850]|uniref:AfsR/SARP family transcriptional regulator n=1 Tax=Streptomyces sp. NPDC059850 TaxID=3346970 RepID=UPI003666F736
MGIWRDDQLLGPTAAQQRSVLAMLVMEPGRVVSVDRLVMAVWGEDPPGSARNAVQVQISKLRRILAALPDTELTTSAKGYCLTTPRTAVDLHRFRDLVREARTVNDDRAAGLLRAALQLWRGPALADVAGGWLSDTVGAGLEEERRAAVEECAALDVRAGRHHEAAAQLSALVAEHPLREGSVALLMEALRRSGRRADALALFRATRQRYAEELGIEPGEELQRLHRQALEARGGFGTGAGEGAGYVPAPRTDPGAGDTSGARAEPGAGHAAEPGGPSEAAGAAGVAGHEPEARTAPGAGRAPEPRTAPGAAEAAGAAGVSGSEDGVTAAPGPHTAPAAGTAVPAQLPPDVAHFTGRERELGGLDSLLRATATAAVIGVIAGSGGLGKTTLAVHWAHRVRDRFPDGQLYVNLRGFGPTGSAMTVAEAVRGFLDAFQVPAHRIPATVEAQTALYRSLLADRRVLVLLDNARDAEQVRPLLPGSPGCLVVLTSRNELTGLVVAEQARPLPLDLLGRAEARELLIGRIGAERAAAEPQAVEDVVTVCAGLPLALAIVAARAATHPRFSIAALAGELHGARGSLDAFEGGDATTDVRAVFSWSYHSLGADAARLFRLLGVHPGPYIAAPAAASLAGVDVAQARRLLSRLTRAHLLAERSPGRYAFHDLLRAYAMELTQEHDSADERRSALHRVLDHYLHSAFAAGRAFTPYREPIALGPARPGVAVETFGEHAQALTWFTLEHPVLIAALQRAADAGFETHAWQLSWTLAEYLDQLGHWHDQRTIHRIALGAAHRIADPAGQAHARHGLGLADLRMGRYDRARGHLLRSLDLHGETANHIGQARIHVALNMTAERQGRDEELLYHARRSMELYQVAGHRRGEAYALNNMGWAYAMLGDCRQTLVHCAKALALLREAGDGRGESAAWDSLGYAHHHLGDHQQAIACYRRAVELRRGLDERVREAESLYRLGDAQRTAGDVAGARDSWRAALSRFDALGHPDADLVRDGLARLDEPEPDSAS